MEPENDEGSIEYKRQLINMKPERLNKFTTQMAYRLSEGSGECIYYIGINDDGTPFGLTIDQLNESIQNLEIMSKKLGSVMTIISKKQLITNPDLYFAEAMIRENNDNHFIDVKVVTLGNANAGKSSLLGVLTTGHLDDGRGLARSYILMHQHELETGRTSTITFHILGFDENGLPVNQKISHRTITWPEIYDRSSKIISFIDLAGHEKYLKTTIRGVSGSNPDYAAIIIEAGAGIQPMTKEHIQIALSYRIPFFFIITKIDICPQNVLDTTIRDIKKIARSIRRVAYKIGYTEQETKIDTIRDDVITCIKNFRSIDGNVPIIPYMLVSNKTGHNIDTIHQFLNLLPVRIPYNIDGPSRMSIIDSFNVSGIGLVVHGIMLSGKLAVNDKIHVGPDSFGNFKISKIKSIECKRRLQTEISTRVHACFALKNIDQSYIQPGMIISTTLPKVSRNFKATVWILRHPTHIKTNYEAVCHIGNVRQITKFMKIEEKESTTGETSLEDNYLRTGDKAVVYFQFKISPQYVEPGTEFVFREGLSKGKGIVLDML